MANSFDNGFRGGTFVSKLMWIAAVLLTVVFVTLKAAGVTAVATWSWVQVLLPLLIALGVQLASIVLVLIFLGALFLFANKSKDKR